MRFWKKRYRVIYYDSKRKRKYYTDGEEWFTYQKGITIPFFKFWYLWFRHWRGDPDITYKRLN